MNDYVDLIEKNVIHINRGTAINVHVSVKNIIYGKKIMFEILLLVVVKIKNIYQVLQLIQGFSVLEVIEVKETNFIEKNITCKTKFLYFSCLFINCHCIIDSS